MRKKIIALLCGSLIIANSLVGCEKKIALQKYISLDNYKEIKIEGIPLVEVTEDEINQYIEEILMKNAEEVQIEKESAKEGDVVYVDFTARLEGKEFEEISEEDCMLTVGVREIADGLDQSIIGHFVGDRYEFTGRFLNDFYNVAAYYDEDAAGKEAIFEITIKSISRLKLPELNDEFVKNVSEKSKTVKEYRKEIAEFLKEDGIKEIDIKATIWQEVVKDAKVKKYPKKELETYIKRREKYYKNKAKDYGMTYKEFIKNEMGSSKKNFEKRIQNEARISLKEQLIARTIAKEENIMINATDVKLLEELAWENNCEDIKQLEEKMSEECLYDAALLQGVKMWLVNNSKIEF